MNGFLGVPQGRNDIHADRGYSHAALDAMAGPEFSGTGSLIFSTGQLLLLMRPAVAVAVVGVILLAGMAGCTAALVDYQHYTPSPNICRAADSGVPPEKPGSCVTATQVVAR
ncbi:hypothetical protein [Nocardia arthritidis]|uniref:Uncharacterized protein n=1 Tax=Nocardia arthritidis TaxID=228602 RepID=A0A6G9YKC3_9NOCA|nr:hypothetical protein [Nocardia arthritidis]QIS13654.1 hypothetical protein F5544_29045 [Nocardia arthritidis]